MQIRSIFLVVALTVPVFAQTRATSRPAPGSSQDSMVHNVFWQPNDLHQGSPLFLTVALERPAIRVTGNFADKPLNFFSDSADKKTWHVLAGISLEANPNDYSLNITATLAGGRIAHSSQRITIAAGDFQTGSIEVPENFVNPSESERRQIAQDELLKKRAYLRATPRRLWSGDFIKPVKAVSTPTFGESRILNEEKTSLHTGTDFPAPQDTPVLLSNAGTVVLVHALFYEGNTVIVDHGLGLFTVYLHMSRIDVHEGDKLDKGAKLGLSGASGRVTGPHLHFGVRWNGIWLDPVQLLGLTLPKTGVAAQRPATGRTPRRR